MNKNNPNKPEWTTTINLDIYDQSESLFISVFYCKMPDNTQQYSSCKIKLCDWCTENSNSGFA